MTHAERESPGAFEVTEEQTSPGLVFPSMPPLPEDRDEALGVLMAATARNGRHIAQIKRDYGVIRTEVMGLRKDIELDRNELVDGASRKAAKHSSNRMAALMGALFTAYELASPYLSELWRLVRHHG
jgi:hypothetical protein